MVILKYYVLPTYLILYYNKYTSWKYIILYYCIILIGIIVRTNDTSIFYNRPYYRSPICIKLICFIFKLPENVNIIQKVYAAGAFYVEGYNTIFLLLKWLQKYRILLIKFIKKAFLIVAFIKRIWYYCTLTNESKIIFKNQKNHETKSYF